MGKRIRENKDIDESGKFAEGRKGLMLLIKPASRSIYKNVFDALEKPLAVM